MTTTALIEQHTATDGAVRFLSLDLLPKSSHVQVRAEQNAATVTRYAEAYTAGTGLPPVVVFEDRTGDEPTYWLADGHHRVAGARKAKLTEINAIIKPGDRRAALLYAAGANSTNGLPLTNDDKRRTVNLLLADAEWRAWSDRAIAEACRVSPNLVGKCRAKLPAEQRTDDRKGKDGRTRNTAAIGKKPEPAPAPKPADEPEVLAIDPNLVEGTAGNYTTGPSGLPIDPVLRETARATALSVAHDHAVRVLEFTRDSLADELDKGKHRWQANDRTLVALALIVGVPTGDDRLTYSDDLYASSFTVLADRLKAEVIDLLRKPDARCLPPLATLAGWWGVDARVIEHRAERRAN